MFWALGSPLLAIPGASFAAYYAHLVPAPATYYQLSSLPGCELLIIPMGIAGGSVATFLPRPFLILPLLTTTAFSITPFAKPILGPLDSTLLEDRWDGPVCLQSTLSTCGAASTATILREFGIKTTGAEITRNARTYAGGTEI